MPRRRRDDREYVQELLSFEPKMRSMIHNFKACGYRFDGHDEDDLTQELFVRAIEIEDVYDIERAAIRTWWYRCFVAHLVKLAERGDKAMKFAAAIDDGIEFAVEDPMFVPVAGWKERLAGGVDEMFRMLRVEDPYLARMCEAIMDLDGDKPAAAEALRVDLSVVNHGLWRLCQWRPYQEVLGRVPF